MVSISEVDTMSDSWRLYIQPWCNSCPNSSIGAVLDCSTETARSTSSCMSRSSFSRLSIFSIVNLDKREKELRLMQELVDRAVSVLQSSTAPIEEFGQLLHQGWMYKRQLSDMVSTSDIDTIYESARNTGAIGGKLLGAGGGGFFLLFVRPEHQKEVREKLSRLVHVPFRFESSGSRVVLYQPSGL